jgi:hypothetical protein
VHLRTLVLAVAIAAASVTTGCGTSPSSPGATTSATAAATTPPTATATTSTPVTPSGITTPANLGGPLVERIEATAPKTTPAPTLLFIGDSLAVGTAPDLPALLPDWNIEVDATGGRITGTSMQVFRSHSDPVDVVAFSAFTADPPQDVATLEASVRESVERVYAKCVAWATLYADGQDFSAANAKLHELAQEYPGRLMIVPWAETVAQRPELLADGVHGTPEGFKVRAELYADAARRCLGES